MPSFRTDGKITPIVTQKINRASQIFNLSPNRFVTKKLNFLRIVPLINYLNETERSTIIDRWIFKLLSIAAKVKIKEKLKTRSLNQVPSRLYPQTFNRSWIHRTVY